MDLTASTGHELHGYTRTITHNPQTNTYLNTPRWQAFQRYTVIWHENRHTTDRYADANTQHIPTLSGPSLSTSMARVIHVSALLANSSPNLRHKDMHSALEDKPDKSYTGAARLEKAVVRD